MSKRWPKTTSDRDLTAAILQEGAEQAFRELYRRYTPRLYQFVLRVVGGDELDAEDVVQETWIRACGHLERFRWESAFATWLLGIGLNVARGLLRRRSRQETDLPEPREQIAPSGDPDARLDLERAIAGLPDGCRLVLVLHDVEGLKHHEIGIALGIVPGTSKSQLHQARQLLRARLAAPSLKGGRP